MAACLEDFSSKRKAPGTGIQPVFWWTLIWESPLLVEHVRITLEEKVTSRETKSCVAY